MTQYYFSTGIDICTWTVNMDGEKVQYSVWDFAGQTVYYNTHQVNTVKSVLTESCLKQNPVLTEPCLKRNPVLTEPWIKQNPVLTEPWIKQSPVLTEPWIKQSPVLTEPCLKQNPE